MKLTLEQILERLPHKHKVLFAYNCCLEIKDLITKPEDLNTLSLVEQWLKDPKSVSNEELRKEAEAAASASAIYTTYTAYAASYAAYAAAATYYAASSVYAGYAAYAVSIRAKDFKLKKYEHISDEYLKSKLIESITELERLMYFE